jgi:hypothetical protein
VPVAQPAHERLDSLRLIAFGLVGRLKFEIHRIGK